MERIVLRPGAIQSSKKKKKSPFSLGVMWRGLFEYTMRESVIIPYGTCPENSGRKKSPTHGGEVACALNTKPMQADQVGTVQYDLELQSRLDAIIMMKKVEF